MSVYECASFGKLRQMILTVYMSMCYEEIDIIKYTYTVVGLHWKIQDHLVNFRITVSSDCDDIILIFIQHCKDFLRTVIFRQVISRAVVQ